MIKFERGEDPKVSMGIGFAGIIKRFDELGKPYYFQREKIPEDPFFYHHDNKKLKWIQHWINEWSDLISLYEDEKIIKVFFCPGVGGTHWDQSIKDWIKPEIWKKYFDY